MKVRAIITGATGMVGEGVLLECLQHPDVEAVLIVNRKPSGFSHPKMKELIHENFFDVSPIEEQLKGYNACFFCLGVSSVGMKEPEFTRFTYTLTMHFATTLSHISPDMTFCYISGARTDDSEQGKVMWARVKGKTENDLAKLPFKAEYNFRPGFMKPTPGAKNTLNGYKLLGWLYPILKMLTPSSVCSLKAVGQAMISVASKGYEKRVLEVNDIKKLAGE